MEAGALVSGVETAEELELEASSAVEPVWVKASAGRSRSRKVMSFRMAHYPLLLL